MCCIGRKLVFDSYRLFVVVVSLVVILCIRNGCMLSLNGSCVCFVFLIVSVIDSVVLLSLNDWIVWNVYGVLVVWLSDSCSDVLVVLLICYGVS